MTAAATAQIFLPALNVRTAMLAGVRVRPEENELELERQLVVRAQAKDREALGQLLGRYGPALYRSVLLPRLGSEAAAKDALGETYAKVVERIDRFTWQNVGFYPWLRTLALHVAIDQLRARKRMVLWDADDVERTLDAKSESDGSALDQSLSEQQDRAVARAKVARALEAIHPRYARAIQLRILEERPREEVAAMFEVTPATFDVLLHRAIAALKKSLGDAKEPEEP
ncbi:RNA polymerase sigma factor [Pendulispora rubella]|uniref:RNA polymerase sigma factor n=1 Tax=Pendulispora rubella TaxID=2741070 RepID=A0ABZ2LGD8_9BACT